MRVPEETLQEIRTRTSIVEVVGRHVALRRSGKNWKGLCPFHAEKTPSFVVNEERGTYHCFGCGAGGNAFRFLMEAEGRTFLEAVRVLAERAGVKLETGREDPARARARAERGQLWDVLDLAARYYRHQLASGRAGAAARRYLERRGVPAEAAETFGLGCAPAGWDNLARFLRSKGVPLDLAERAGLVVARESGGHYDRLRDRLVFPIHDASGRPVSFGGRVLGDGEPKYLNGPETEVFRKRELLYGLYQGSDVLRRTRRALLVEGYLDVISLHVHGHGNALATLGTSLTAGHLHLLRRWADEVVLVYDGDEAGRRAAFRGLDLFLAEGFPCRAVLLPDEHDPDSFVRAGHDLASLVDGAPSLMEAFLADVARRYDLSGVEGRLGAVGEVVPRLRAVTDPLARDLYLNRAADLLDVPENALRERLVRERAPGRAVAGRAGDTSRAATPVDPVEQAVVACLVRDPATREPFRVRGVVGWMRPGPAREAARFVSERVEAAGVLPVDGLDESVRQVVTAVLVSEAPAEPYPVLEARLELRFLEERRARLQREIRRASAGGTGGKLVSLLGEKKALDEAVTACARRVRQGR